MQAYGKPFAKVYNRRWQDYANRIAPLIHAFYESKAPADSRKSLLDLCCGTGQLSAYFLEQGYRVVGLDLSEDMLEYARQKALPYMVAQQAQFIQGDAADYQLDETFGLVVSTFDALNHLPDMDALAGCFRSTLAILDPGGYFVFDMNTRIGLANWNSISLTPGEDIFLLTRGIFDEYTTKAWTKITGFLRNPDGFYERFDETVYNTVFEIQAVCELLLDVGFASVYTASGTTLSTPIAKPESEAKVFFVVRK
jgi:SAM-dependent methyltransferase